MSKICGGFVAASYCTNTSCVNLSIWELRYATPLLVLLSFWISGQYCNLASWRTFFFLYRVHIAHQTCHPAPFLSSTVPHFPLPPISQRPAFISLLYFPYLMPLSSQAFVTSPICQRHPLPSIYRSPARLAPILFSISPCFSPPHILPCLKKDLDPNHRIPSTGAA